MIVYGLPQCSTTKKALQQLTELGFNPTLIDYREHPISFDQLQDYIAKSGVAITKWFNTSGQAYRTQKEELQQLSEADVIQHLAVNPMLVKRPIMVSEKVVLVGIPKAGYASLIRS